MKSRPPLFFRFQANEIFRIEETRRVGPVIRASCLTRTCRYFWEGAEQNSRAVHQSYAFTRPSAWSESAANPDRALIQMGQEFRSNAIEYKIGARAKRKHGDAHHD